LSGEGERMRVEELMQKDVRSCGPDDAMNEAARIMWEADCGFVPVVDPATRRVIGVITDRDVCMASYTRGRTLAELRVRDAMSVNVRSCAPGDSLGAAEGAMRAAHVRRLPVCDAGGQLLGVLSLADLARGYLRQRARGKKGVTAAELGELIAEISEPRQLAATASR
jgi:CBS domain-containing protein